MPIEVPCPQCKCVLKAPEGMGGKKARCKRCQHSFRIPGGDAASQVDSVGDSEHLSVIAEAPFSFDAPPAVTAKKPTPAPAAPSDNPFAIPTTAADETPVESKPEPKSKSKYKTKPEKSEAPSKAKGSNYRLKTPAAEGGGKRRTPLLLLAALLCAGGGAGGFYAYTEYEKSKAAPQPVAKAPGADAPTEPAKSAPESAKDAKDAAPPSAGAAQAKATGDDRKAAVRPNRTGPKVTGGMKLPPFADKPKPYEKAAATIGLDHDANAVKQIMVGGAEGPVMLVMRRTFDGLGGKGMKDTIDRYALNTLRRIDQTEVPADAVKTYPRIADIGPSGDRLAMEHPAGKLTVRQLGTNTAVVEALDLADKDAAHPGIAAIYFLTDEKLLIVTKAGVVESWDLAAKKKVGASDPIPGAANLVDRRSLAFHRDRDPDKSLIFAFAGGAIHSVAPGGKPQLALTVPHAATQCLALAVDGGANRLAVAYRASDPGEHVRFLHSRVGDPKPGSDDALDAEVGVPVRAEWTRPETFSIMTDKGLGFAYDADTNGLIAGYRTLKPTQVLIDGAKHWCLLPDPANPKKAVLVNVTVPPDDYSTLSIGSKWKPIAITIDATGTSK